jgi:signal transduction histidine kinase
MPLIEARSHRLSVAVADEPLRVSGDLTRLTQVVANLLNNAAKYTEDGGQIWIAMAREHDDAIVRIRDTGVGLTEDMLENVFEPFTQVERSLDRSEGGLGIGLTLARRLVELHDGRLSARSDGPCRGSEFTVRLPVWKPTSHTREEAPSTELNAEENGRSSSRQEPLHGADGRPRPLRQHGQGFRLSRRTPPR